MVMGSNYDCSDMVSSRAGESGIDVAPRGVFRNTAARRICAALESGTREASLQPLQCIAHFCTNR